MIKVKLPKMVEFPAIYGQNLPKNAQGGSKGVLEFSKLMEYFGYTKSPLVTSGLNLFRSYNLQVIKQTLISMTL